MEENVKPRILVVEDEASLARFLQLELNHEGYQVEIARDGYEACVMAKPQNRSYTH